MAEEAPRPSVLGGLAGARLWWVRCGTKGELESAIKIGQFSLQGGTRASDSGRVLDDLPPEAITVEATSLPRL